MESDVPDSSKRLILCLVADEQAVERFPTALRYLQIGLIDEPIDTIIVVSERGRPICLEGGPATIIAYHDMQWPLTRWGYKFAADAARRKVNSLQHDAPVIVHALTAASAQVAVEIAEAVRGELVLTISSIAEIEDSVVSRCCAKAATLILPSRQLEQALAASPLAGKTTAVVPVGVVSTFAPAAFSNPQRAPSLVYAGTLSNGSAVESLLRAAKLVLAHDPNLLVFVVGKGPAESNLRHLSDSLELHPNVTFTGRLEHWRLALEAADIFCLPASQGTFHEELIHALATGLAVVAPADCVCDGLIDDQTALLFPGEDHVRMAAQISRLLADHALARRIAAAGQSYARASNSVARMVAEHVRIYRELDPRGRTIPMPVAR
ncbi:MAG TPA: glycosyltransferase family 4 protein [Phycisphaerae bacterium]|nr:glycosyltransferase family 4 protein [Phycisphaerae bacterium]